MNYIYDILINLNNKKNYEFYEWKDNDSILHVRKIPIIKINNATFLNIKKYNFIVDNNILNRIKNKTEIYQDLNIYYLKYLCCFVCTQDIIVVEFNKDGYSINKSNLLLEEASDALYESNELEIETINYKLLNKSYKENINNTRYEEEIKRKINKEIYYTIKINDYDKLKYLYYEWYNKKDNNINNIISGLKNIIRNEFSNRHEKFYNVIKLCNTK